MNHDISTRLKEIEIQIASRAADRKVEIVGVTKHQPVERLREAVRAGIKVFGVNYAQEGEAFRAALGDSVRWDFIGHIQSRKAKHLLDYDRIQSLDRASVAEILNREGQSRGTALSCLVEINIGEEPQKSGVLPSELDGFLKDLATLSYLKIDGFMGMPPPLQPVEARRPHFKMLREFFDRYREKYRLSVLSMGTSEDFLIAVEEGSTMVRLGTSLFGARPV